MVMTSSPEFRVIGNAGVLQRLSWRRLPRLLSAIGSVVAPSRTDLGPNLVLCLGGAIRRTEESAARLFR